VFSSSIPLVSEDTDSAIDVYLRDVAGGTTTLVSGAGTAGPAGSWCDNPVLSADGRSVGFESAADLDGTPWASLAGGVSRVRAYVRDLQTNALQVVSATTDQKAADGTHLALSGDGRFVGFNTSSAQVVPADDAGAGSRWVVLDRQTGAARVANRGPDGLHTAQDSFGANLPVFSRSGNTFLFMANATSVAPLLFPGVTDNNATNDLIALTVPGAPEVGSGPGPDVTPPTVSASPLAPMTVAGSSYDFSVTYTDDVAVDALSLGNGDFVVTGPGGFSQPAALLSLTPSAEGEKILAAAYRITGPGGSFDSGDNGAYSIAIAPGAVADDLGNAIPGGPLAGGAFTVDIPVPDGPDLKAVSLAGAFPASVVAGAKAKLKPLVLTITNAGNAAVARKVAVRLVASADESYDAGDATVVDLPARKLALRPGASRTVPIKPRAIPALPDGDYHLLAVVDATQALTEAVETNNVVSLAAPVRIAAPFADVALTSPTLTGRLTAGKPARLIVTARNDGNAPATGDVVMRVRLTATPDDPASGTIINVPLRFRLNQGATAVLRGKLTIPANLAAGSYYVAVMGLDDIPWTDPDRTNETPVSANPFAVGGGVTLMARDGVIRLDERRLASPLGRAVCHKSIACRPAQVDPVLPWVR
jgi:hypothetical protein